jgi:hypothetical protein
MDIQQKIQKYNFKLITSNKSIYNKKLNYYKRLMNGAGVSEIIIIVDQILQIKIQIENIRAEVTKSNPTEYVRSVRQFNRSGMAGMNEQEKKLVELNNQYEALYDNVHELENKIIQQKDSILPGIQYLNQKLRDIENQLKSFKSIEFIETADTTHDEERISEYEKQIMLMQEQQKIKSQIDVLNDILKSNGEGDTL